MSDTNLSSRSSLETSVSRSPLIGREDEMRAIVARLIDPGLTLAVNFAIFLAVLLVRPTGLFGSSAR